MNSNPHSLREQISHTLEHLDHVLPGQGPILDFVHHNTLHGFQHLPFDEALAAFKAITGTDGYLPEAQFRAFYQQGRITEQDLSAALASRPDLQAEQIICVANDKTITRGDIYRIAMLFDLPVLSVSQLNWQIEALCALTKPQADVPKSIRNADKQGIKKLWVGLLNKLELENAALHPEELLDGTLDQTEDWLAEARTDASTHPD
ncbi:MAG: Na-translocating system protein MpsB, partial [Methylococcaceae bacterium]|nr:Na-translocating system protein MpsB [Methylococcaceae bacterium]